MLSTTNQLILYHRQANNLSSKISVNLLDFIGRNPIYLKLLDWHKTFPKVWGVLGWNVKLYHSHLIVTPPTSSANPDQRLGWHQDSGRLNIELEGEPRPRVSLKVAFFLSDTTAPDRGNFHVVPGSHLKNNLELPYVFFINMHVILILIATIWVTIMKFFKLPQLWVRKS